MNSQSQKSQGLFPKQMAFTWLAVSVLIVVLDL